MGEADLVAPPAAEAPPSPRSRFAARAAWRSRLMRDCKWNGRADATSTGAGAVGDDMCNLRPGRYLSCAAMNEPRPCKSIMLPVPRRRDRRSRAPLPPALWPSSSPELELPDCVRLRGLFMGQWHRSGTGLMGGSSSISDSASACCSLNARAPIGDDVAADRGVVMDKSPEDNSDEEDAVRTDELAELDAEEEEEEFRLFDAADEAPIAENNEEEEEETEAAEAHKGAGSSSSGAASADALAELDSGATSSPAAEFSCSSAMATKRSKDGSYCRRTLLDGYRCSAPRGKSVDIERLTARPARLTDEADKKCELPVANASGDSSECDAHDTGDKWPPIVEDDVEPHPVGDANDPNAANDEWDDKHDDDCDEGVTGRGAIDTGARDKVLSGCVTGANGSNTWLRRSSPTGTADICSRACEGDGALTGTNVGADSGCCALESCGRGRGISCAAAEAGATLQNKRVALVGRGGNLSLSSLSALPSEDAFADTTRGGEGGKEREPPTGSCTGGASRSDLLSQGS